MATADGRVIRARVVHPLPDTVRVTKESLVTADVGPWSPCEVITQGSASAPPRMPGEYQPPREGGVVPRITRTAAEVFERIVPIAQLARDLGERGVAERHVHIGVQLVREEVWAFLVFLSAILTDRRHDTFERLESFFEVGAPVLGESPHGFRLLPRVLEALEIVLDGVGER